RPVRESCKLLAAVLVRPRASSSSRGTRSPASLVTVEPWNSTLIRRSNSTCKASFWLSPIGLLSRFGRISSETLGCPGKWRKRRADTSESSGKSGLQSRSQENSTLPWRRKARSHNRGRTGGIHSAAPPRNALPKHLRGCLGDSLDGQGNF